MSAPQYMQPSPGSSPVNQANPPTARTCHMLIPYSHGRPHPGQDRARSGPGAGAGAAAGAAMGAATGAGAGGHGTGPPAMGVTTEGAAPGGGGGGGER